MKPRSKRVVWIIIISLFIFVVGSSFIIFFDRIRGNSVTNRISIVANSVALAVNPDRILSLQGNLDDKNNPDYQRLREQLQKVASVIKEDGIKWIYTINIKDNKLIFLVDSVPEGEFGHSEPGDEYKNPPEEFKTIFKEGKTIITPVYTDEWGKFISVLVPIKDFETGKLISIIGFDLDYSFYKSEVAKTRVMTEGVIMLIYILTILVYLYFSTKFEKDQELIESEQKFKVITESALDPIIMMDQKGIIVLWNNAAEKVFKYSSKEALGKYLHHLIIPSQKYNIEHSDKLKMFQQTGQSPVFGQVLDLETISKDGKSIPVELSISGVKLKKQNYAIGIIRDISIRKQNENELKNKNKTMDEQQKAILNIIEDVNEEKSKTDSLLSSIGDGVVAVDTDSKITYINSIAENLLGYKSNELIGKISHEIILSQDNKGKNISKEKRPFVLVIKNGKTISTSTENPVYYFHKNKTKFPVSINISPIKVDNKIIGAINIFRDITHEIEVDQMKTEFISLASHQLRTPLSAMRWFSEMLLAGDAGKLTKEQKEYVTNISLSNDRMIALVNSLLNISRIESGRIIIDPEPTDLAKLIQDVLVEIDNKIKEKKQQIIISIHSGLPKINIDPKLIREVYKNLLTNANKYTPEGGEISIFISKKDQEIVSQISDNGYGIPTKDQAKIFEKFYRAENIVKLETEGTGLGLYLAKSIVESSSGKLWFESQEKVGTTFWFTLPLSGSKAKKGEVTINS